MSHAQRVSRAEVVRAMRVVHEACELGRDPLAWRAHMAAEACRLVGARAAFHDEEMVMPTAAESRVAGAVVLGIEGREAVAALNAYLSHGGFNIHPYFPVILPIATRAWTRTRRELVPDDRDYYHTVTIWEYKRPADIDDNIHSRQPIGRPGWANMLALFRDWGAPAFTRRERRIVHLIHSEVGRLWRKPPPPDPADALPPRQRQLVQGLRRGESEKGIAYRLGLSPHTVHTYMKALYQRVGVSGRFDLLERLAPPPPPPRPRLSFEVDPEPGGATLAPSRVTRRTIPAGWRV